MRNKDYLVGSFRKAHAENASYVGLSIMMEGYLKEEFIINPHENILDKMEYYINTYDDDLYHKFSKGIRIVAIWVMKDDKWSLEAEMG